MARKHHKKNKNKKVLNGIDLINQSNNLSKKNNNDNINANINTDISKINNNHKNDNTDDSIKNIDKNIENINKNNDIENINNGNDKNKDIENLKNIENENDYNLANNISKEISNDENKREKTKLELEKNINDITETNNLVNDNLIKEKVVEKTSNLAETKGKVNLNVNEKIQSFISILFTVIIFFALILLIITLYKNNFSNDNNSCDKEKICQEYIKNDYNINTEEVIKFIKLNRGIFYTMQEFDNKTDLNTFITYYIWSREGEYLECSNDPNCLVTKKEIDETELLKAIKTYLNKDLKTLSFNTDFKDTDNIRLYKSNEKIVLTFKEFIYESLRHEIINTIVDENNIKVYLALLKNDNGNYDYVGYKEINLKYLNNNYIIESIKTNYAN